MKLKLTLFPILIFMTGFLSAQNPDAVFSEWGKGLIFSNEMLDHKMTIDDLVGLPIYHQPNGYKIGSIVQAYEPGVIAASVEGSDPVEINRKDRQEFSYEVSSLIWFEEQEGFIRFGLNSGKQTYWLKTSEVEEKGLRVLAWVTLATELKRTMFPERLGIRMNLRSQPNTKGKVLAVLTNDQFFVTPTGKSQGMWLEVKVVKHKEAYCEGSGEDVIDSWTGWIKFVDDKGHPNMWFYSRGC